MDRSARCTTCRCGYSSPSTLARCLGCNRRFARCDHVAVATGAVAPARPRPTAAPRPTSASAPTPPVPVEPPPLVSPVPVGGLAVLGLVAAAWLAPDAPRVEILTVAAGLGAAFSLANPSVPAAARPAAGVAAVAPALPSLARLSDDELRDAISAW